MMFIYNANNESPWTTAAVFNNRDVGKNVSHVCDVNFSKNSELPGLANLKRRGLRVLDETTQIEVLGHFAANPCTLVRRYDSCFCWICPQSS